MLVCRGSYTYYPYQTLLLTVDVESLLSVLPSHASAQLHTLVRHANPLHSFHTLSTRLGICLPSLYTLSAHLVYWNKARIIDHIELHHYYGINGRLIKQYIDMNALLQLPSATHNHSDNTHTPTTQQQQQTSKKIQTTKMEERRKNKLTVDNVSVDVSSTGSDKYDSSLNFLSPPLLYDFCRVFDHAHLLVESLHNFSTIKPLYQHFQSIHHPNNHVHPATTSSQVHHRNETTLRVLIWLLQRQWVGPFKCVYVRWKREDNMRQDNNNAQDEWYELLER